MNRTGKKFVLQGFPLNTVAFKYKPAAMIDMIMKAPGIMYLVFVKVYFVIGDKIYPTPVDPGTPTNKMGRRGWCCSCTV